MSKGLRIIVYRVGQAPTVEVIPNTLDGMQSVVGGYIEHVSLPAGLDLYCNEEGHLLNLPFNRTVRGHYIHGDFFLCRTHNDENADVTDADIAIQNAQTQKDEE